MVAAQQPMPFVLKGSLFTITVMQLSTTDIEVILAHFNKLIEQTPKFFQHAPMVLDMQRLQDPEKLDLTNLIDSIRSLGPIPIGIRGATDKDLQEQARMLNLAIFPASKADTADKNIATAKEKARQAKTRNTKDTSNNATKIVTQPVRSGQQLYAKGGDLIVTSSVSNGAELLADGNIHIYGKLRGRALAGVNGNLDARIFCKQLDPELIAIAGHYQINENLNIKSYNGPVQIYLQGERLQIESV